MNSPELLAPAGSLAMLDTAFAFGADAVYAGQPRYSLRVRNNDFGEDAVLAAGVARARALGKAFYLVANIFPHGAKLKTFLDDLAPAVALRPDALIMSDPGLILLARETWPELPIHLSVQANTVNAASARFWQGNGIARVILSRELSLDEIADIRQACPELELEVFVHGALCVAYSGRCLLSGYFNHRDANQGSCTNACRWAYRVRTGGLQENGDNATSSGGGTLRAELEEGERPGQWMPIEEDEHGSYILNSRDLRALEHVRRLVDIGVDSLKIEGRTKSPYYVARAVQAYRRAIDAAVRGEDLDPVWFASLDSLSSRGYTDGFLQRHHDAEYQNYLRGHSTSARSLYVGDVVAWDAGRGRVRVVVKNRLAVGDRVELVLPAGNQDRLIEAMYDANGEPVTVAPGIGHVVELAWPAAVVGAYIARYL